MRSLFVTMDPNVTGAAAAASTLAERGSAAERALPRSGVGVRIISTAAGIFLALVTVSHGQSPTRGVSSTEPPRPQSFIERLPIAADGMRQTVNRQTPHRSNPSGVPSRNADLELQQLYDDIIRRVDMTYKDAR
jgi:hypothetical protein